MEKAQADCQGILSQIQLTKQLLTESQERIQAVCERISETEKAFFDSLYHFFPDGQESFLSSCAKIGQISEIEKHIHQHQLDVFSLDGRICQLKEQLSNVKPVDITILLEQEASLQQQIQALREEASAVQAQFNQDIAHKKQIESIYQKIEKTEQRYRQVNELFRIASGNNDQRVSFERYVLGFYFDAIVSFANHRLES